MGTTTTSAEDPDQTEVCVLTSEEVLRQELHEIERRRAARSSAGNRAGHTDTAESCDARTRRLQLTALCLSGGGIRSAAFCLGVLQALGRHHLLRQFDYLSTVSGGGFIGSWLQILMRDSFGVREVEDEVADPNSRPLGRLRGLTNYLTPQTGPFSADTWAGIVLYLRNLLINWWVFTPLFLLLTLLPIFYRTTVWGLSDELWPNLLLLAVASAALLFAVYQGCNLLPSHRRSYADHNSIERKFVTPALVWTFIIPIVVEFGIGQESLHSAGAGGWLLRICLLPAIYLLVILCGYGIAWGAQLRDNSPAVRLFALNCWPWFRASAGSAILLGIAIYLADKALPIEIENTPPEDISNIYQWMGLPFSADLVEHSLLPDTETVLTVFAPLVVTIIYLLQTALYVGFRRGDPQASLDRYDLDREWLARASGLILRIAVAWTLFSLSCLILPVVIGLVREGAWNAGRVASAGSLAVAAGSIAAWLGKIAPDAQKLLERPGVWPKVKSHLPDALAVVFGLVLLMVFGSLEQLTLGQSQVYIEGLREGLKDQVWLPLVLQLVLSAILMVVLLQSGKVNVNRFSMHAVYRNRLTRAFLGSARAQRNPDPFTGFDPEDNPPLGGLRSVHGPFPVINIALNITAGSNTAWAERKAASFTATPFACGSPALQRKELPVAPSGEALGAYVATTIFAGVEDLRATRRTNHGSTLGTMLTVSGAAISPNWGYHSSRLTAFLMTLFNVRLGLWLPNPAEAAPQDLVLAKPRNSLMALLSELIGRTTDRSKAIYLSDGGHFDNLGLYEMLRRRCTTIVVIDADTDPNCALFDLGDAIRKADIDLGAAVTMQDPMQIYAREKIESDRTLHPLGVALGTIRYKDGLCGRLLYVKPSFLPGVPAEVRAYATQNASFPHEPITDQWFSESQFESYRGLGMWQMQTLTKTAQKGSLDSLFRAAEGATNAKPVEDCRTDNAAIALK